MIISSPFGPTILTGDDAKKFKEQVSRGIRSPVVADAIERGRKMSDELKRTGKVRIPLDETKLV